MDDFDARIAASLVRQVPFDDGCDCAAILSADRIAISRLRGPAHARASWIQALDRVGRYVGEASSTEDRRERLEHCYRKLAGSDLVDRNNFTLP